MSQVYKPRQKAKDAKDKERKKEIEERNKELEKKFPKKGKS